MAWPVNGLSYEHERDGHPHNDQLPSESMNRIGRRTIFCMLLIVALAIMWNLFGG
jgi:hypothetical protein